MKINSMGWTGTQLGGGLKPKVTKKKLNKIM